MRQVFGFVFVLGTTLAGASLGATGCSSSEDTGTTADTGVKKDTGTTGEGGTDTGTATDTGTKTDTGGGDDAACGAKTSNKECQTCCSTNHATAYGEFVKALLTCGCKAGNCDKDCATTACAATPASPDAKCNTCLSNVQSGACKTDLSACASAACKDFFSCVADQACNDKP